MLACASGPKIGVVKMGPLPHVVRLRTFFGVSIDLVLHCSEGVELLLGSSRSNQFCAKNALVYRYIDFYTRNPF